MSSEILTKLQDGVIGNVDLVFEIKDRIKSKSVKQVAAEVGISEVYLYMITTFHKPISAAVAKRFGYEQLKVYRKIQDREV